MRSAGGNAKLELEADAEGAGDVAVLEPPPKEREAKTGGDDKEGEWARVAAVAAPPPVVKGCPPVDGITEVGRDGVGADDEERSKGELEVSRM